VYIVMLHTSVSIGIGHCCC